jgi:type II secretory ATPase GspE/PulE/Tfp pilus assembly ATPase PilB-like protein
VRKSILSNHEGILEASPIDEADAPIVRLVSMLRSRRTGRCQRHSSRTAGQKFRVRFRIDGVLQEMQSPPALQSAIISRLKIMTGSMSIAEKRLPQDGRTR